MEKKLPGSTGSKVQSLATQGGLEGLFFEPPPIRVLFIGTPPVVETIREGVRPATYAASKINDKQNVSKKTEGEACGGYKGYIA